MIKLRILGLAALGLALAAAAGAQTKVSGTVNCTKPDVVASADIGDMAGHSMSLQKSSCTWTTPMDLNGDHTKQDELVMFSEAWATKAVNTGDVVGTLDNGDKFYVNIHESATIKNGQPAPAHGTWTMTGGTGKIKGIKGKGTYVTTFNADGTATATVEGEYTMPAAKPPSK